MSTGVLTAAPRISRESDESMKRIMCAVCVLVVGGCPMTSGSMTGASAGKAPNTGPNTGPNDMVTIPNVVGMTKEEAVAKFQAAGILGSVTDDSSLCGSVIDGRVIELGQVCYQHPPAGRAQGARLPVSIRVQTENPWHGNVGKATEWHLMPKIVGLSVEQARAEMQRVGFRREDRVLVSWVDEPGCTPLTICRTYPAALERAGINSDKIVFAGRDPNAKPKGPDPKPPEATKPVDPKPADTTPQPEPFF